MDPSVKVYISLSLMMFFQFAVWGAWAPVLAARLLGPLKMSGKQTGWIYTTLPLACIFAPLVAGQLADRYFNLEWILAAAHLIAAVMMFIAVRQKSFGALFAAMLGWSICYAGTLPLVNTALFSHMKEFTTLFPNMPDVSGTVFIWAPIGWAVVGYSLSGWRMLRSKESDGTDAMVLSAVLGVVMAVCCLLLPATAPAKTGDSSMQPLFDLVKTPDFLVFIVTSICVAGTMQFYFVGSGQYMMDRGISGKAVPGAMALAQVAQAIATWFALGKAIELLGFKWTLVVGTSSWVLMYVIYTVLAPRPVIFVSQVLHGIAYVMFMIVTQVYCGAIAPAGTAASMQALIFAATVGVGLFLGTQLAGFAMDRHKSDGGKFLWSKIWTYPLVITLAGTLIFATVFRGEVPKKPADERRRRQRSNPLRLPLQHREHPFAELRQVIRPAAADMVAIDHNGSVFPKAARVNKIILDAGRAGDANAAVDVGRNGYPTAVTDSGDQFAGGVEIAD
jgi:MFS family permease